MIRDWMYSFALLHPLSVLLGLWNGGNWIYTTIFLSTIVYPAIEILAKSASPHDKTTTHAKLPKLLSTITVFAVIFTVFATITTIALRTLSIFETIIIIYSCGLMTGITGIVLAHEMLHRRNTTCKLLGAGLLILTSYPHFKLQHLYGHHPNVATKTDHSSAQQNQSLYNFFIKSIFLGGFSMWKNECNRSFKLYGQKFHPRHNRAIFLWTIQCLVYATILYCLGPLGLAAFITQGIIAILVLETVNYIQHYGLNRSTIRSREPDYSLSWDNYSPTNYVLFNLGLHSDHHAHPAKPFYMLLQQPDAPKMPYGYFTMAIVALFPKLWRSIMSKHALQHKTKIQP